jgi:hypothetical protein
MDVLMTALAEHRCNGIRRKVMREAHGFLVGLLGCRITKTIAAHVKRIPGDFRQCR